MRCGECGNTHLERKSVKGCRFPYKSYQWVEISKDGLDLLTCQCGNHVINSAEIPKLDQLIRESLEEGAPRKRWQYLTWNLGRLGYRKKFLDAYIDADNHVTWKHWKWGFHWRTP